MLSFQPEPRGRVGWGGGKSRLHGAQGVAALGTGLLPTGVS